MNRKNSPYSSSHNRWRFPFEETKILLPLLMADNSDELLQEEKVNNNLLHINAETARARNISEIRKRFNTMPIAFWNDFNDMNEDDKVVALFFVILKTYKICFDFHVNVTMRKWNSISKSIDKEDVMMEFNEISAKDDFVDSWSDKTKGKVASAYLTILRKVGILGDDGRLHSPSCSNYSYYLQQGESWFLEACLLQPYEISNIKKSMV